MDTTFGELLSSLVRQRGMTMAEFASTVELSPSSLSRVRTGQRLPADRQLQRWGDALRLNADERTRLRDLLLLARTPIEVRTKLVEAEERASAEQGRRAQVEEGFGRFRRDQGFGSPRLHRAGAAGGLRRNHRETTHHRRGEMPRHP